MLLADLVETSAAVASTRARSTKTAALADLLVRLAPDEIEPAVGFLTGDARQGRIGVGWATLVKLDVAPATVPTLTIADVDRALDRIQATTGSGSSGDRHDILRDVFDRATQHEIDFLRRLLVGELRQGALAGADDRRGGEGRVGAARARTSRRHALGRPRSRRRRRAHRRARRG